MNSDNNNMRDNYLKVNSHVYSLFIIINMNLS